MESKWASLCLHELVGSFEGVERVACIKRAFIVNSRSIVLNALSFDVKQLVGGSVHFLNAWLIIIEQPSSQVIRALIITR